MRDWIRWNRDLVLVIGIPVVLLAALIVFAVKDAIWWDAYSVQHHCERTGNVRIGYTYFTSTSCGNSCTSFVPVTVPDSYEYACDDRSRHWR